MATRTNLCRNPSFETNTNEWTSSNASSFTHSSNFAQAGSSSARLVASGSPMGIQSPLGTSGWPVTGSTAYTVSAYFRPDTTARNAQIFLMRYTSSGSLIDSSGPASSSTTLGTWNRKSASLTVESNCAYLAATLQFEGGVASGEVFYIDSVLVEQASSAGTYFDGDTPDTGAIKYSWTGTAHASTSTAEDMPNGSASGSYAFAGSSTGVAPFAAPTGLVATAVSNSQIDLTWDVHPEALWYEVERDSVVIARLLTTNSYSDTGLSPATLYTYRVRAVKNNV